MAVEDVNQVILDQLRLVANEVQRIPQMVEQLRNISTGLARLEQHDEEQGRIIADLRMSDHQFTAALTVLTSELKQLAREVDTVKQDAMPLNAFIQKVNAVSVKVNKLDDLEKGFAEKLDGLGKEFIGKFDDLEKELIEWRPWMRVLKWAATIAGAALVLAVVYAIFWAVQSSGALIR